MSDHELSSQRNEPLPPRITRIQVTKLLGSLNHEIKLNQDERVTIIYGINGVGKTKLLELTAALTNGHLWQLIEIPFQQFRLDLSDGTSILVKRTAAQTELSLFSDEPKRGRQKGREKGNSAAIEIQKIDSVNSKVLANWPAEPSLPTYVRQRLPRSLV